MAMQGGFFGCLAHSGEGAALRELNGVKIAAFVVVNASGSITDRNGNVVKCNRTPPNGSAWKIADLMNNVPLSRSSGWASSSAAEVSTHTNTTVSLIVTNARLDYAGLRRLAIQVHISMARAIQPFSTFDDGDTLFAATTDDIAGALCRFAEGPGHDGRRGDVGCDPGQRSRGTDVQLTRGCGRLRSAAAHLRRHLCVCAACSTTCRCVGRKTVGYGARPNNVRFSDRLACAACADL